MPETDHQEVFEEKHYSPSELAKFWGVSPDTIRRVFAGEVGILVLQSTGRRKRARSYKTLRIPASVAARVYQKHCTAARFVDSRNSKTNASNNPAAVHTRPRGTDHEHKNDFSACQSQGNPRI
jgi:hypothetical protein